MFTLSYWMLTLIICMLSSIIHLACRGAKICRHNYPRFPCCNHYILIQFKIQIWIFQLVFGLLDAHLGDIRDFSRSADGSEIFFTCAGWCAMCGPTSGPLHLKHSDEFSKIMLFQHIGMCMVSS